jgi:hypothetical protein
MDESRMSLASSLLQGNLANPGRDSTTLTILSIDLSTLADLHRHGHSLAAFCPRCDRWHTLPLAELVAAGHGPRRLPLPVRCKDCGEVGRLQVRPPVPTRDGTVGWMEPLR